MSSRELRFGVRDRRTDRQSTTWKVWIPGKKSDVYVAAREMGRDFKVSLHESGSWQLGFVEGFLERELRPEDVDSTPSRHIEVWSRPPELLPGVTRALQVLVQPGAVCRRGRARGSKRLAWADLPPAGLAVEFTLFILSAAGRKTLSELSRLMPGAVSSIGEIHAADESSAHVVWRYVASPDLGQSQAQRRAVFKSADRFCGDPESLVGYMISSLSCGTRRLVEGRLDPASDVSQLLGRQA